MTPAPFLKGLLASRVAASRSKRKGSAQNRRVCPHCNQTLCYKTFKKHKRLYAKDDGSWISVKTDSHYFDGTKLGVR